MELREFLNENKVFNISALAEEIGVHRANLHKWLGGDKYVGKPQQEQLYAYLKTLFTKLS